MHSDKLGHTPCREKLPAKYPHQLLSAVPMNEVFEIVLAGTWLMQNVQLDKCQYQHINDNKYL